MKIVARVTPKSRKKEIKIMPNGEYAIKIFSLPEGGKANIEVIDVVAEYFKVAKRSVKIVSGLKSKRKTLEIYE